MGVARFIEKPERELLLQTLTRARDRLLVELGLNTGLRVSSMLSLRWKQLWRDGDIVSVLEVPRRYLKGGQGARKKAMMSRRIPVNESLRGAILEHLREEFGELPPLAEGWVFRSQKRSPGVISRQQAYHVIRSAAQRAGLDHGVAPHGLRRSFAHDIYDASGHDLVITQKLLGHASVETTAHYLRPEEEKLDSLVLGLPFSNPKPAPLTTEHRTTSSVPQRSLQR
ncbi:tyrosine-type recombinase/integrase [Actomonas aquatica]|uniref:Tyrosine-type recombinase/integrase n=1 Tax=Actomonas aquatica TaxID=2866162 RepID=A0ABZ1C288_9BACT|nr:tyrosine-type recombinase/integrase [Opitutus sp. WL0086]WRQ85551.1 tyrosine-type recombinase/integrase [Opitutus sp. WL0086]